MLALFGKVDVAQFLIAPLLVKTLVSFVLGESVQSNRYKPVFPGMIFCKIHHFLSQALPLEVRMNGKAMNVSAIAVRGDPLDGFVFFIH